MHTSWAFRLWSLITSTVAKKCTYECGEEMGVSMTHFYNNPPPTTWMVWPVVHCQIYTYAMNDQLCATTKLSSHFFCTLSSSRPSSMPTVDRPLQGMTRTSLHRASRDLAKASKRVAKTQFFGKFYLMWSKECVKTTTMLWSHNHQPSLIFFWLEPWHLYIAISGKGWSR